MKKIQCLVVLAGAVLLFASQGVRADMADGSFTNQMGALVPLWDITGSYANTVDIFSFDCTMSQAVSGKITGLGTFAVVGSFDVPKLGPVDFNITNGVLAASGSVSGPSTAPKVSLTFSGSGSGTADSIDGSFEVTRFKQTSRFTGEIDGTQAIGNVAVSVDVTFIDERGKPKSLSHSFTYKDRTISLPTNAIGTNWTLTLNLTPDGTTKYNPGSATILTSAGDTADFIATGTYSTTKATSKIQLTGTGSSKGSSLTLGISTSATNLTVETLSGKVFGQSLKLTAP
ncbi:MAG: hypothetical protein ABSA83_10530 [Verrucomicrobiota bacterium]|jgi:hypothetical protein